MTPETIHYRSADRTVEVRWSDGHVSSFPSRYLRGWCPCALCQGHFRTRYEFVENDGPELDDAVPVGNYGVAFHWSDGHSTGIFRFGELRAMCPCETCDGAEVAPSPRRGKG